MKLLSIHSSFILLVLALLLRSTDAHAGLSTSISWSVDPESQEDVLRGFIQFTPTGSTPECGSIRFIQSARVEITPGVDLNWGSGEANRNLMRTANGFFVDHDAFKCSKGSACSPYFRDSWPNPDESKDGSNTAEKISSSSLIDYPLGWSEFQRITLESCALCVESAQFLGCVRWGGDWPGMGGRTLISPTVSGNPSTTFLDALARFNLFYSKSNP